MASVMAFAFASQAEAAKATKHRQSGAAAHPTAHRQPSATRGTTFQGGVLVGPLYNGQDYLGDDPDPNIRAYLLKDMGRYGGSD